MFRKIAELFAPWKAPLKTSEDFEIPFHLSASQLVALKRLRTSDEFNTLREALDEHIKLYGERILTASKDENLHFLRGVVVGIREALTLPDQLANAEETHLAQRRQRTKARESRQPRAGALYGTPGWRKPTPTERS